MPGCRGGCQARPSCARRARRWAVRGLPYSPAGLQPCRGAAPVTPLRGCTMGCGTRNRPWRAWECPRWKTTVGVSVAGSVVSSGRRLGAVEQAARAGWGLLRQGAVTAGCVRANSRGSCGKLCIRLFPRVPAPPLVTLMQLVGVSLAAPLGDLLFAPWGLEGANLFCLAWALREGCSMSSHVPVVFPATRPTGHSECPLGMWGTDTALQWGLV